MAAPSEEQAYLRWMRIFRTEIGRANTAVETDVLPGVVLVRVEGPSRCIDVYVHRWGLLEIPYGQSMVIQHVAPWHAAKARSLFHIPVDEDAKTLARALLEACGVWRAEWNDTDDDRLEVDDGGSNYFDRRLIDGWTYGYIGVAHSIRSLFIERLPTETGPRSWFRSDTWSEERLHKESSLTHLRWSWTLCVYAIHTVSYTACQNASLLSSESVRCMNEVQKKCEQAIIRDTTKMDRWNTSDESLLLALRDQTDPTIEFYFQYTRMPASVTVRVRGVERAKICLFRQPMVDVARAAHDAIADAAGVARRDTEVTAAATAAASDADPDPTDFAATGAAV